MLKPIRSGGTHWLGDLRESACNIRIARVEIIVLGSSKRRVRIGVTGIGIGARRVAVGR